MDDVLQLPGGLEFSRDVLKQFYVKCLDDVILVIRADEIRARVTLTPLPLASPSRDSNLVRRGEPVINPL